MSDGFEAIIRLTQSELPVQEKIRVFKDFSQQLGWVPSERLEPEHKMREITNGHLIVEHGLENSAVITFLINPTSHSRLESQQVTKLLEISYNNLVDWHLYVEKDRVTYVFNRTDPPEKYSYDLSKTDIRNIRSNMFNQITGKAPNPNFPSLDNALVENISFWKRNLAAELENKPALSNYSALFNSIMFVRAAEDHKKRLTGIETRVLIEELEQRSRGNANLRVIIKNVLEKFVNGKLPKEVFNPNDLKVFDDLDRNVIFDLMLSFYKSRKVPYGYDFAIMSKHALSRIYEHYVSLLSFDEDSQQLSFLPKLPQEDYSKTLGSVYTPQFIARFFSRFIRDQLPPKNFRRVKTLDPACGSGIFLRTMLELQCALGHDSISSQEIREVFQLVKGIDIDENATQATRLSLSMLYLVLMSGDLPSKLNIVTADSLEYFVKTSSDKEKFDAVVANPPFVPTDIQPDIRREKIKKFMGNLGKGKIDNYLPFIKIAVDSLKPGGFGMFVLPHSFLRQSSSENIRLYLSENCYIRCLVDLSEIPVFEPKGSYVILLIFQKKMAPEDLRDSQKATIVLCSDYAGNALEDYLGGLRIENNFYQIFDVDQESFTKNNWDNVLLSPRQAKIQEKFDRLLPISHFLNVKQGIVTGGDDVFIVKKSQITKTESKIWRPLLKDRELIRYRVPRSTNYFVFYPVVDGEKLNEAEVKQHFPQTWEYLIHNRNRLPDRKARDENWWRPNRLRIPKEMFGPKIITPHLVLLPKFSLDEKGKYSISRTMFLVPKEYEGGIEILKFFLGVLNSTIGAWLISKKSDKYSHGYARLEVKTLNTINVPNPAKVSYNSLSTVISLVDEILKGSKDFDLDIEIDKIVSDMYGLSLEEKFDLGLWRRDAKDNN